MSNHLRLCWSCKYTGVYTDNVLPVCACSLCGSADTRLVTPGPLWRVPNEPVEQAVVWTAVPDNVSMCPECGSGLVVDSHEWEADTGRPIATGLQIECVYDEGEGEYHRYWQGDWQPVRDAVAKWCKAKTA